MSGPSRREVEALFEAALARPPGERGRWLGTACRGDARLRAEVEALLRAHERAEGVLEADLPPAPSLAGLAPELDRVGRYRVVGELARGGMGAVYLADRDDGHFRQRVAVKVLRRSAQGGELRRRFEAERQILAALEHPHIARLLDGGITDDGRPFLVMEYVEGRPVDEYCEAEGLGLEDRLRLFCKVARAVHHAHGRLVVHRDLKPSNVLVTDAGEPKLLDFGIAKILDPGALGWEAPETRTGLRLMTPEYAAPEQVLGEPATTAADVYGLGVVLYELLAGRRPFHLEGCTAGEAERVILQEDPAPPSERAGGGDGHGAAAAGAGPGGRRWRRRLEGDLDRIVLKALRKEPGRRYVSAGQMAGDVERHLEGRPVLARGDSLAYRGRKFVRRHLLGLASAAAVLAALVAGTVLATVGMVRAERAEAVARREAASARQVSQFLVELFEVSDPGEARGTTVTAREILDRGSERISRDLEGQPLVQARLMGTVGEIYRRLGLYGESRPLLVRALEVRRRELGEGHPEVADALHDLGHVLEQQGRFGEAADRYAEAVALRERLGEEERVPLARSLTGLAVVRLQQGRAGDAAGLLERAIRIHESSGAAGGTDLAWALHNLAVARRRSGDLEAAEALYRRSLALREAALPPDHPDVARSLNSLGVLHMQRGDLERAEPLFRRALGIKERVLGADHREVATSLSNLAIALAGQGRHAEAEPHFLRSLRIRETALGPRHPEVADQLHNLGFFYREQGRWAEAEAHLRRAMEIKEDVLAPDHPRLARTAHSLGSLLLARGRPAEAEPWLRRALEIQASALSPDHPDLASTRRELAEALRGLGRGPEADSLDRAADGGAEAASTG